MLVFFLCYNPVLKLLKEEPNLESEQPLNQVDGDGYENVTDEGAPVGVESSGVYDELPPDQEPINADNNYNDNGGNNYGGDGSDDYGNNHTAGGTDIPGDYFDEDGDPNDYGEDQNDEE